MKLISHYLGAPARPEGHLAGLTDRQIDGSCLWLTTKSSFQEWQSGTGGNGDETPVPKIFCLSGLPGIGKSVLAAHVVRHLEADGADCSYFFLSSTGDNEGSNAAALLRSLALQMAETNPVIRQQFLSMFNNSESFDKGDERSVWKLLFQRRILSLNPSQPRFWVIDALDECPNYGSLLQFLARMDRQVPIRIFITTRPLAAIERIFSQKKLDAFTESVTREDTTRDIRTFFQSQAAYLPVEHGEGRDRLIERIVEKSNGSFLWASMVSKELEQTYSEQQIDDVLEQVPSELDSVYDRILDGISEVPRNLVLAKGIFRWTVCAPRRLSIEELKYGLILDTGHAIPRLDSVIGSISGHLVDVDKDGKVYLVHETVKAFLTKAELRPEYRVERREEHARLAKVCLTYLVQGSSARSRASSNADTSNVENKTAFGKYAARYFSYHLAELSSALDSPLMLLDEFFRTSALAWIETIARDGDLGTLLQTSRHLKVYLARSAKHHPPLDQEVARVRAWSEDLIRLVAAFGRNILSQPESIHFLVPPLCPSNSMIRELEYASRFLEVVGISEQDWDDRISCIIYPEGKAWAIAVNESRFAVGLSSGGIHIYTSSTFEESQILSHSEPVRHLCFSKTDGLLTSCGRKHLRLWDPSSGAQLWQMSLSDLALHMSFDQEDRVVMLAFRNNKILSFDKDNGHIVEEADFFDVKDNEVYTRANRGQPTHIAICSEMNMMGVAYCQDPISFWDLEDNSWLSHFHKDNPDDFPKPVLLALTINPNPELELAAAWYQNGELVTFNPFDGRRVASVETSASILASTTDGRTLATGDGSGVVQLFEFETLRLLYKVSRYDFGIRTILFAPDNLRFFEIRSDHCNVWEPTVLVRKGEQNDDLGELYSDEIPQPALLVNHQLWSQDLSITALCNHHSGDWILAGRAMGSVSVFDVSTGGVAEEIISPTATPVTTLLWNATSSTLVIVRTASSVSLRTLTIMKTGSDIAFHLEEPKLQLSADQPIRQLLLNPAGTMLLVSTDSVHQLWDVQKAALVAARASSEIATNTSSRGVWASHPSFEQQLIYVEPGGAHIFGWETLTSLSPASGISWATPSELSGPTLGHVVTSKSGKSICLHLLHGVNTFNSKRNPELQIYLASTIDAKSKSVMPANTYTTFAGGGIKAVIGPYRSSLVFLDPDGWVCSVNIDSFPAEAFYKRHFFIPFSWHNVGDVFMAVTRGGSVALARKDELAIFHNGLEFCETQMPLAGPRGQTRGDIAPNGQAGAGAGAASGVKISRRRRPAAKAIRSDIVPV